MQINDTEDIIDFRRQLHRIPETGFKENNTHQLLRKELLKLNVKEDQIQTIAQTGLIVSLRGTKEDDLKELTVAFRADIDGLTMTEDNPHLEYKSQTDCAHMCGHDGHMAMLMGAVLLFQRNLEHFSKNRTLKMFFQPSEEGPNSGAEKMILEGCLENIDEVYGIHNMPTSPVGTLQIINGPVMAAVIIINITLKGVGGHGSRPDLCIDPVSAGVDFHLQFRELMKKYSSDKFLCTLPVFQGGERYNVFCETAKICGTARSLDTQVTDNFEKDLTNLLQNLSKTTKIEYILDFRRTYPVVDNKYPEIVDNVKRVGAKCFGAEKVIPGSMPMMASEDFSFFILDKPGAFFYLGGQDKGHNVMLHDNHFDFNDRLISIGSEFWYELAKDRLN